MMMNGDIDAVMMNELLSRCYGIWMHLWIRQSLEGGEGKGLGFESDWYYYMLGID